MGKQKYIEKIVQKKSAFLTKLFIQTLLLLILIKRFSLVDNMQKQFVDFLQLTLLYLVIVFYGIIFKIFTDLFEKNLS